jgi:signal transduction histidine kinase
VADNGTGIPHHSLQQIFEPFYTTKKDAGTGLGLWVSRGIVQKHGGSIRVRSRSNGHQPGRITGTVFSIFLPERQEIGRVA